jgi:Arc/MetJ family transcription regulator
MALTQKRAYTLDADVVAELEQEFGPGERSRFVSEAARRALITRRGRQFLRDREQQFGAVPADVQRAVDNTPIPS